MRDGESSWKKKQVRRKGVAIHQHTYGMSLPRNGCLCLATSSFSLFSHILLLLAQSISSPSFCSLSINKSPLIPCNVGLTLTLSLRISSPTVCRHVSVSVLICLQSPDSLIALLVYLQISQFAPLPSIWHRPPMSQWSDKTTDVFAFCSGASL